MLFKIIALSIMITFYACYYAKQYIQKKKGIKTNQLGKGKKGKSKFIEIVMYIATMLVFIIELFSIVFNKQNLSEVIRWIGVVVSLIGVIMFILTVITMKDSWRAGVPVGETTKLVTKGVFKISRNPAFLGFDLLYVGILLMFFNYYLLGITIIAIIMFHLQIVFVEEKYLTQIFGKEYTEYKNQVNRYFGIKW